GRRPAQVERPGQARSLREPALQRRERRQPRIMPVRRPVSSSGRNGRMGEWENGSSGPDRPFSHSPILPFLPLPFSRRPRQPAACQPLRKRPPRQAAALPLPPHSGGIRRGWGGFLREALRHGGGGREPRAGAAGGSTPRPGPVAAHGEELFPKPGNRPRLLLGMRRNMSRHSWDRGCSGYDRLPRRDFLRVGSLTALGLTLPDLLRLEAVGA